MTGTPLQDPRDLTPHLLDDVLAWWMANGPDEQHGGVLTCWNNTSTTLVSTDKYTWSQGRWAWLTARVALAGRSGTLDVDAGRYAELATSTARFIRDYAVLEDGSTAFVTRRHGRPRETAAGSGLHTSVFADLFAALGFAGTAMVETDAGWSELAEETLLAAAERIGEGVFRSEPYPAPIGYRSFSLPMILVVVGEQVHRVTGSVRSAQVVANAAQEIARHHLTGNDIAEMPPRNGASETLLARHRTPGHVLEALWFLHHARDLVDEEIVTPQRLEAIACHALELGWDSEHGGLFRYVDADGGPPRGVASGDPYEKLVTATWDTKLWWPHAEALYATRLLSDVAGGQAIARWHQQVVDYTLQTFPEGPGREWSQIRSRDGSPMEKVVALPVKDPFHVARALLMSAELDGKAHPDNAEA